MKRHDSRGTPSVVRKCMAAVVLGGVVVCSVGLAPGLLFQPTERHVTAQHATALLAGLARPAAAEEPSPALEPDQVAEFMRAKLDHSRAVLEGLAIEDYELMARAAQDLALASQASSWQVLQTEEYARQSVDFRRACVNLRDAAKAKNLDAAALAWVDVTLKCVQCHRYVRDAR